MKRLKGLEYRRAKSYRAQGVQCYTKARRAFRDECRGEMEGCHHAGQQHNPAKRRDFLPVSRDEQQDSGSGQQAAEDKGQ